MDIKSFKTDRRIYMECVFCHKEKLVTDIFPRYKGDGFGWTYGEDSKNVNSEIAKRIRDRINLI
ncbi:MAG: hypothetical protein J6L69_05200 [Lachnospiraceae bacterium]|nr:hypothetical protein [Lachnospiraceae bacterium]